MSALEIHRPGRRVHRVLALCLGCAMTFAAQVARSECTAPSCTDARVLVLYTEANGNVYVKLSGTMSNLNCTLASGFVTLVASNSRFKEIYASLLAAQLSDRLVAVRINDGSVGCTVAYITMDGS
jgi:hypothetical protein